MERVAAPGVNDAEAEAGLSLPIEELGLSARTANALINNDIKNLDELIHLTDSELKELKGFGSKALEEVKEKITELTK